MNTASMWVLIAIVALAILFLILHLLPRKKRENKLTPIAGLAFGFVLAGLIYPDSRMVGYGLTGIGIILAIADIIIKYRRGR